MKKLTVTGKKAIAALLALALLFKDTIIGFVSELLGNISGQGSSFDPSTMVP